LRRSLSPMVCTLVFAIGSENGVWGSGLIRLKANLLMLGRDLAWFNLPPTRDYLSVKSYFDEEASLCNAEGYIYCKEDVITLKCGRENACLMVLLRRLCIYFRTGFIR